MVKTLININERISSFKKQNKINFKRIMKFEEFDNIEKGTLIYCFPKIKSNRLKKDKTETWEIHEYLKKTDKYIHLLDKYYKKWKLEYYYAGNTGRKGLFVWYNKKNRPTNWNCEYLIKIKNDHYKKTDKVVKLDQNIENYDYKNTDKVVKIDHDIQDIIKNKINKIKEETLIIKKGRWSTNEHDIFKKQLCIFYNSWKKYNIYTEKGSRGIDQIRSHSQKYFKRLRRNYKKNKFIEDSNDEIIYISSCLIYLKK